MNSPLIERFRQDPVRRSLTVAETLRLTPHMQRITLTGPALAGFSSLGFDDHIKLLLPTLPEAAAERRDYTPRRHDPVAGTLVIDFALHDAGPATAWALTARVGDSLDIAGPRGSARIGGPVQHWLLIGDETALPAIGRKIEETDGPLTSLVAVPSAADEQVFENPGLVAHWVHRPQARAADPTQLLAAARQLTVAPDTFVWIAAEAQVARALRQHFLEERGHPKEWLKASGYWVEGKADTTEKFAD